MAIWNLGSINIDHVYVLNRLPLPGETLTAVGYSTGLGGKGANQSVAAARAGASTYHLGAIGADNDWVLDRLSACGIDISGIQQLAGQSTGHAIILLDRDAENAIVVHPGANRGLSPELVASLLAGIGPGDTLLLQNETSGQVAAAKMARSAGARVIYSAAPFDLDAVRQVLPHVSLLAMNAGEAERLLAAIPRQDLPVDGLLVTRGSDGAQYHDLRSGEVLHQPAFAVAPRDTTAAGDCFAGYFAAGLDAGRPIRESLRLAAAAAALKVTRTGAADAIPLLAEVRAFLSAQPSA